MVPNSIYKCSSGGAPVLVETCENALDCISIDEGAMCVADDCKCPDDGIVGGDVFPLSCRLSNDAVYTCKKGENPILLEDCSPKASSAALATMQGAAVFNAQLANDKCVDQCLCTDDTPVSAIHYT